MPGIDGIAATRRIVATGGRTSVLILTTFDLTPGRGACARGHALDVLLERDEVAHGRRCKRRQQPDRVQRHRQLAE